MRWLVLVIGLVCSPQLFAQEISVHVDKNQIGLNERIRYTIDVTLAQNGQITQPAFTDFHVLGGPMRSQQTSIINGAVSQKMEVSYIIRPKRIGTLTIEPSVLSYSGEDYESPAIEITVTQAREVQNTNLMAKLKLSKRSVYEGEHVVATYSVLNRYNNMQITDYNLPEHDDFVAEEVSTPNNNWLPDPVMVNGRQFKEGILRKEVLFPEKSGEFELEPYDMSVNAGGSFFSAGQRISVTSNRPKLDVKPLPSGAPASFSGGVGEFEFELTTDKTELPVNEPITMKIKVSGKGNLKLIDIPAPGFPSDFEVYDPEIENKVSVKSSGVSGSRTLEYLIIPRHPGQYDLGVLEFSYFDPSSERYITHRSDSIIIDVLREDGTSAGPAEFEPVKTEVAVIAEDIRHLKAGHHLVAQADGGFLNMGYLLGLLGPGLLFFLLLFAKRRYESSRKDESVVKERSASKMAMKRISAAKEALSAADDQAFYAEIQKAIYGYLADKMQMPTLEMEQTQIKQKLIERGYEEETVASFDELIERCLLARYAPVSDVPREEILKDTETLIRALDKG